MKHLIRICIIAAIAMIAGACTESKLKQFAQDFATAVASNDSVAIATMYPDAHLAEKLEMAAPSENVTIEEVADTFVMHLDDNRSLKILKSDNGDFIIVDSHGLFAYPAERMDFALKTGWVKDDMSDLQIAEQFSDTTFVAYLTKKYESKLKTMLKIAGTESFDSSYDYNMLADFYAIVVNNSDVEIKGTDYKVWVGDEGYNGSPDYEIYSSPGKDIKPGEKLRIRSKYPIAGGDGPSLTIRFLIPDDELLAKYFTPKGGEYDDYLRSPIFKK